MVFTLTAHLVFVTKYRRAVFTDALLITCEQVMADVCTDFGAELIEFNGEGDHVHLLVSYPPQARLSELVRAMKGVSSRHLRSRHSREIKKLLWGEHLWSPSYFAASTGGANIATVRAYIEQQQRPS